MILLLHRDYVLLAQMMAGKKFATLSQCDKVA